MSQYDMRSKIFKYRVNFLKKLEHHQIYDICPVRQQCDSIFRITPYFTKLTHSYPKRAMGDDFVLLFSFVLPQYVKLCGKNLELQKAKHFIF